MKLAILVILIVCTGKFSAAQDTVRVYFEHDEKNLANSGRLLDSVAQLKNVTAISIIGYTDHLGTNAYNIRLSKNRAEEVKAYLSRSLNPSKIKAKGKGEINIANNHPQGEPLHRRADIVIHFDSPNSQSNTSKSTAKESNNMRELAKLEVGDKLILNTFHFIGGRHFLLPQYVAQLDTLANILAENPGVSIEIQGFVCCTYEYDGLDYDTGEYTLSINRAKHIYEQMIKRGINKDRMRYKGFGSKRPRVAPEVTEEDRTTNRRVEILVIDKK